MELRETLHQGEAEAEALLAAAARALVGLAEGIEHERKEFRRDTRAAVAHVDASHRPFHARADTDRAARRELDRVGEEVHEDLPYPVGIAVDFAVADGI